MKLHLGCGKRYFHGWEHIDSGNFEHVKSHDVTKLPYPDATVDIIYASHLIAYFDREEIKQVFKEWKRVLKPGGTLRIATPDFKAIAKLYVKNQSCTLDNFLGPLYGKWDGTNIEVAGNSCIQAKPAIYHKTTYDLYSLMELLITSGFRNPHKYNRWRTEHARYDDHSAAHIDGQLISLNVECYA